MDWFRLFSGCGGFGFARLGVGYLATEALDAACGIDQLLLAGKERVAGSADFNDDVALVRGTRLEGVAAGALQVDDFVLRVDSLFWHDSLSLLICCLLARGSLATVWVHVTSIGLSRGPQSPGLLEDEGARWHCADFTMYSFPLLSVDSHMGQFNSVAAGKGRVRDT